MNKVKVIKKDLSVLISIVNYNSHADTLKLINYIENEINKYGFKLNYFITDNSSEKLSQKIFIEKLSSIVPFIKYEDISSNNLLNDINIFYDSENKGFGAANNKVFEYIINYTQFDAVWLLNNDVELRLDTLVNVSEYLYDDKYFILGSGVYEHDLGLKFLSVGVQNIDSFRGYGKNLKASEEKKTMAVDSVLGTSMFIKKEVLKHIKFDENYFMYVEENDFCYRSKKMGFSSHAVLNSIVTHVGGKTFGSNKSIRWYYKVRNILYLKTKTRSGLNNLLVLYLLFSTIKNYGLNRYYLLAYINGIHDFMTNKMGPYGGKK